MFNILKWTSYPQECRKHVREAVNSLKSNLTTDHCEVHKENLSVSQDKLLDEGSNPSRSTTGSKRWKDHLVLVLARERTTSFFIWA